MPLNRRITIFVFGVVIAVGTLACSERSEYEKIANTPIESRTADDLQRFLTGRWKLGKDRLDGVVIREDSLLIVNELGEVISDDCHAGRIEFMEQSKIDVRRTCLFLGDLQGKSGDYPAVVKIHGPHRIGWWLDYEPSGWRDGYGHPVLIRAEGGFR